MQEVSERCDTSTKKKRNPSTFFCLQETIQKDSQHGSALNCQAFAPQLLLLTLCCGLVTVFL